MDNEIRYFKDVSGTIITEMIVSYDHSQKGSPATFVSRIEGHQGGTINFDTPFVAMDIMCKETEIDIEEYLKIRELMIINKFEK